jgi:hypothetical protein
MTTLSTLAAQPLKNALHTATSHAQRALAHTPGAALEDLIAASAHHADTFLSSSALKKQLPKLSGALQHLGVTPQHVERLAKGYQEMIGAMVDATKAVIEKYNIAPSDNKRTIFEKLRHDIAAAIQSTTGDEQTAKAFVDKLEASLPATVPATPAA